MDDTEEFRKLKAEVFLKMSVFLGEFLPKLTLSKRRFLAEFIFVTISSLAEAVTGSTRSEAEVKRYAQNCADMILSFLGRN